MRDRTAGLSAAAQHARDFLDGLDDRPVAARVDAAGVRDALGGPLPEHGEDPKAVIDALAAGAEPGLVATAGPRHFGFVIGGALPAALAAEWLMSAWDQNAAFHALSPAAAAIEEITSAWIVDVLGLPSGASVGFVTGGQAANTTCLAAARHAVLAKAGWNVEDDGLIGAPRVRIFCGEQAHATIDTALRLLGLGGTTAVRIAADDQGRMRPDALADALASSTGPAIVCAQAGNVATGAFDAFEPIADACAAHGAWLHVDGAFGLWAAATPTLAAPDERRRSRRLVGRRRAQMAERALRQRDGHRRRPGRSYRRDEPRRSRTSWPIPASATAPTMCPRARGVRASYPSTRR